MTTDDLKKVNGITIQKQSLTTVTSGIPTRWLEKLTEFYLNHESEFGLPSENGIIIYELDDHLEIDNAQKPTINRTTLREILNGNFLDIDENQLEQAINQQKTSN